MERIHPAIWVLLTVHCLYCSAGASPASSPSVEYAYYKPVSTTSLQLVAGIRPGGMPFQAWFECHVMLGGSYRTALRSYVADTASVLVRHTLVGLPSNVNFSFRVGVRIGTDTIFGVSQLGRTGTRDTSAKVTIFLPDQITTTSARLSALCNPNGSPTEFYFEYGLASHFPALTGLRTAAAYTDSTQKDTVISMLLTNLTPSTVYAVRVVGKKLRYSSVIAFTSLDSLRTLYDSTVQSAVSLLTVMPAQFTAGMMCTLNFGVHSYATDCLDNGLGEYELPPQGPILETRFIDRRAIGSACLMSGSYNDIRRFTSPAQSDTYKVAVSAIAELYPLRLSWPKLENSFSGPVFLHAGDTLLDMKSTSSFMLEDMDISFLRIIASGPQTKPYAPYVLLQRPSSFGLDALRLPAKINPNGLPTTMWFEWGLDVAYGRATSKEAVGSAMQVEDVEGVIYPVEYDKLYHYRVAMQNSYGTYYSSDNTFLTPKFTPVQNSSPVPREFCLYQNFPNPFNPTTTIKYDLAEEGPVSLAVYDLLGREVATLVNENRSAGRHFVTFHSSSLSAGMYFYRLHAGPYTETRKMILVK